MIVDTYSGISGDVYKGKINADDNLGRLALFMAFFPVSAQQKPTFQEKELVEYVIKFLSAKNNQDVNTNSGISKTNNMTIVVANKVSHTN